MLKQVQEIDDGTVFLVTPALVGELREVQRQGAVGSEDAEAELLEPHSSLVIECHGSDIAWRERQVRRLPQARDVVGRPARFTQPRAVGEALLEHAQRREQVEGVWPPLQRLECRRGCSQGCRRRQ